LKNNVRRFVLIANSPEKTPAEYSLLPLGRQIVEFALQSLFQALFIYLHDFVITHKK
jgi:hypothetical protein